ncbi:toll-like receptor [Holotrichia oblita]|uniref:Toll-like receptor n=1 Tax=Holotrichia oblita TaxID=644536 RepID=A0ACB9STS3_HOLOL|nr:toll-like receptor [Holotrichia oblita]
MDSIYYILPLFLTLSPILCSKQEFTCEHAPQECECVPYMKNTQVHCPSKGNGEVVIKYEGRSMHITCYNFTYDFTSLNLTMENMTTVQIKNCKYNNQILFNRLSTVPKLKKVDVMNASLDDNDVIRLFDAIKNSKTYWISLTINNLTTFPKLQSHYLRYLDLSNNSIESLTEGSKFVRLFWLNLKNNSINYVNESAFENCPNLVYIDLSNNKIVQLPPKLLHPLKYLKIINLDSNDFHEIPMGFFKNNFELKDVILTNAYLTEIPENMFPNCSNLETLKLGKNSLSRLPQNMFLNMSILKILDLSVNKLYNISDDTFKGLFELQHLYLFHNNLTEWSRSYHQDLHKLVELILSNNFFTKIEAHAFAGLEKLKELDLGYNNISVIDVTAFADLTQLTKLILYNNNLITLDAITTIRIGNSEKRLNVKLSNNNISHINMPDSSNQTTKKKLYLRSNPIACDCQFFATLKYLEKTKNNDSKPIELSGAEKCAYPAKWNGTNFKNIGLHNFTCEDASLYHCPRNCNCQIHPFDGILEINCSYAGFTRLPIIPNLNAMPSELGIVLKSIWMNLTGNSISEFVEDYSYKNVSVLDLSYNKLHGMKWIPPGIQMLHLHNNEFSTIDENVVKMLNKSQSLKKVTFHRNPWDCGCGLVHFAKTLRTHMLSVIPNHTLTCHGGSNLMDLDESTCNLKEIYIVFVVIATIITVTFIILIILYVYFQDYIKLWLYKHKLFLWIWADGDIDKDKKYDAFVSYSNKDQDFIIEHLQPEMERKEKYHLCLHERDWIVGELISKQIIDSVHNSRRTVIVLSKNFLDSEWANMEFKTAYSQSLVDKKNRLIIILYEDIDLNGITNQELKMYLNTQTYLKWGDPWFWKKLKQAMPTRNVDKTRKPEHNTESKDIKAGVIDVS